MTDGAKTFYDVSLTWWSIVTYFLSSWQALAEELEGADVGELESDSSNVVELIEESYLVISSILFTSHSIYVFYREYHSVLLFLLIMLPALLLISPL